MWLLAVTALMLGGVLLFQHANTVRSNHVAFRLCQRGAVDRAIAQASIGRRDPREVARMRAPWRDAAGVLRPAKAPILDCNPNRSGRPARPMSAAAQADFVGRYDTGRLTRVESGICTAPASVAPC